MEWELSKENVQPLRNGRKVEPLNMALKMKAAGATTTRANVLEHQRRFVRFLLDFRCFSLLVCFFVRGGAMVELASRKEIRFSLSRAFVFLLRSASLQKALFFVFLLHFFIGFQPDLMIMMMCEAFIFAGRWSKRLMSTRATIPWSHG